MVKVLKNYWQTILLILCMIIGAIIGLNAPDFALKLKPLGDLFINLIFMLIVPLIFFRISSSIANVGKLNRLGKIISRTLIIFVITTFIAIGLGIVQNFIYKPLSDEDIASINQTLSASDEEEPEKLNGLEQFVNSVTTSDFKDLLSRRNILQIIILF